MSNRDELGRVVREAWVKWAQTQPNPKPHWLVPYNELNEADKEADRQIGEAVRHYVLSAEWMQLFKEPIEVDGLALAGPTSERAKQSGFVYLLGSSSGLHKIGESIDPEKRLRTIRRKKPGEQIDIIYFFPADDVWMAEQRLHNRFWDKRQKPFNEWFNLDSADVARIQSIIKFENGEFNETPRI